MSFMRKKRTPKSEVTDVTIEDSVTTDAPPQPAEEPSESAKSASAKATADAPRKKQFTGQHPDETVQMVFHQHPIVMRKQLILGLGVWTLSSLPMAFVIAIWPWYLFGVGFLLMLAILGYRWIGWYFSIFIISNERLIQIKQKGFFNRSVTDISHSKIQSVNYEVKGMVATMFHFGTIIVQTYTGELVLRFIHKPEDVHQLMVRSIRTVKPVDITQIKGGE